MIITDPGYWYSDLDPEDMALIMQELESDRHRKDALSALYDMVVMGDAGASFESLVGRIISDLAQGDEP